MFGYILKKNFLVQINLKNSKFHLLAKRTAYFTQLTSTAAKSDEKNGIVSILGAASIENTNLSQCPMWWIHIQLAHQALTFHFSFGSWDPSLDIHWAQGMGHMQWLQHHTGPWVHIKKG